MSFPKILSFADVLKKFSRGNTRKTTRRLSFPYFSNYINFRGTTVALVVCREQDRMGRLTDLELATTGIRRLLQLLSVPGRLRQLQEDPHRLRLTPGPRCPRSLLRLRLHLLLDLSILTARLRQLRRVTTTKLTKEIRDSGQKAQFNKDYPDNILNIERRKIGS